MHENADFSIHSTGIKLFIHQKRILPGNAPSHSSETAEPSWPTGITVIGSSCGTVP